MTPHAYAQEYEFRGDTDYTPSDFERTVIEDAIRGYLGEARSRLHSAERAEMEPKPLEWVDYRDSEGSAPRWKAVHPFGEYRIILNLRDMEYWSPQLGGLSGRWNTLEDAQDAAQADFAARIRSCLLDKPEALEVVGSRDALIERLVKALEAAETYVIDGVTTAKQNLEMNAAYPARKPRYEAELQEARDIYAECQAARRAALAAKEQQP